MKKIIFMLLLTIASCIAISSCTEESVQPTMQEKPGEGNGGGSGMTGPIGG
jgi:hypothetical protein